MRRGAHLTGHLKRKWTACLRRFKKAFPAVSGSHDVVPAHGVGGTANHFGNLQ